MNPDETASDQRTKPALRVSGVTRDAFMKEAMAERLDLGSFVDALASVVASLAGVIVVSQGTPKAELADQAREVIRNVADTAVRIVVGAFEKAPNDEP